MSGYHGWMAGTGAFDYIIDSAEELLGLARQQISYALSNRRSRRLSEDVASSKEREERAEELGACLLDELLDQHGADLVEWLYVNVPYVPADDRAICVTDAPYHIFSRCGRQTMEAVVPEPFPLPWSPADLADGTEEALTREVLEDLLNELLPDVIYALPDRFE